MHTLAPTKVGPHNALSRCHCGCHDAFAIYPDMCSKVRPQAAMRSRTLCRLKAVITGSCYPTVRTCQTWVLHGHLALLACIDFCLLSSRRNVLLSHVMLSCSGHSDGRLLPCYWKCAGIPSLKECIIAPGGCMAGLLGIF